MLSNISIFNDKRSQDSPKLTVHVNIFQMTLTCPPLPVGGAHAGSYLGKIQTIDKFLNLSRTCHFHIDVADNP